MSITKLNNLTRLSLRLIIIAVLIMLSNGSMANAQMSEAQRKLYESGVYYYDIDGGNICFPSSSQNNTFGGSPGGSIYVLGDSLTVGMRDQGSLSDKLIATGWEPTKINGLGAQMVDWGTDQVELDGEIIANSDSILIGLGTNNIGDVVAGSSPVDGGREDVEEDMQRLVSTVKGNNPDITIYWTTVFMNGGSYTTDYGTFNKDIARPILNEAIENIAARNNISIIPWGTSSEAENLVSDGFHPIGDYPAMSDYIVAQLNSGGAGVPNSTLPAGCSCSEEDGQLIGEDNVQKVFNYFVGKGYTEEQAAGILGNMIHESGVEPMRLQSTPSGTATPSSTIEGLGVLNDGDVGWGIVQWSPPGKMITPSLNSGVTYERIDTLAYQVDFVWKQLEGTAIAINEQSAGDKLKEATTPEDAAYAFGRYYERFTGSTDPNNSRHAERKESARSVFDIYAGRAPAVGSTAGGCGLRVAGANGWDLPGEGPNPMVYYSQLRSGDDPAVTGYYGNETYGPGPLSACGCGPTSFAMIVTTLTGVTTTPDEVADWAVANGMQQDSDGVCGGSRWWWKDIASTSEARWGVRAREISIDQAPAELRKGNLIMTSVGPDSVLLSPGGDGHLLVMRAVTDDGKFLFADPSDSNTKRNAYPIISELGSSRTPLDAATVSNGLKGLFVMERL